MGTHEFTFDFDTDDAHKLKAQVKGLTSILALLMRDQGLDSFTVSDREILETDKDTIMFSRGWDQAVYTLQLIKGDT